MVWARWWIRTGVPSSQSPCSSRPCRIIRGRGCRGVDPDSFEAISCTYTTTPDEDFILDRIGPVVIGAGFSGHGFKFTPVVGRILADLATGTRPAPDIFRASR